MAKVALKTGWFGFDNITLLCIIIKSNVIIWWLDGKMLANTQRLDVVARNIRDKKVLSSNDILQRVECSYVLLLTSYKFWNFCGVMVEIATKVSTNQEGVRMKLKLTNNLALDHLTNLRELADSVKLE